MAITCDTDIMNTRHRNLANAFKQAAVCWNRGASCVVITGTSGVTYSVEKTSDGLYGRLGRPSSVETEPNELFWNNLAIRAGLPQVKAGPMEWVGAVNVLTEGGLR